jgi:hypothetical protein
MQWICWSVSKPAIGRGFRVVFDFTSAFAIGVSAGVAISLPFFVVWISFAFPTTFSIAYMKEASLLILWAAAVLYIWRPKSVTFGKDHFKIEFHGTAGIFPTEMQSERGGKG